MKKLLSLLMLLCLALTVAPAALAEEVVNVYNWEDYIAPEVLTLFTEETGIKVNYMCFTTNEDMIVQVEANPAAWLRRTSRPCPDTAYRCCGARKAAPASPCRPLH